MDLHWQDGLTWAIVAAAVVYVSRRVWLTAMQKKSGGCGSCGTCPADSSQGKQISLVSLDQVAVKSSDKSGPNKD